MVRMASIDADLPEIFDPALPTEHRARTGRPLVTLSYAQSLDGCIAVQPGQPLALSGPESLKLTHRLRANHDAILVGIGTVLADNPRLNVRLAPGRSPQPVIVDSHLRFPLDARLLQQSPGPWLATTRQAGMERQTALEAAGARVLCLPHQPDGRVNLTALLTCLAGLGVNSLMVEGGAQIITAFVSAGLVDRVVITIAPILVGGVHAVTGLLGQAGVPCQLRLANPGYAQLGDDIIIWGRLP